MTVFTDASWECKKMAEVTKNQINIAHSKRTSTNHGYEENYHGIHFLLPELLLQIHLDNTKI